MSKGLPRSQSRGAPVSQGVVNKDIDVNAALTVNGATGVGFGTAVIGGLPEGNILLLGAVSYLKVTKASSATGIQATFDGDISIGSTPADDATLSGADVDIIPSTALGAATSGSSPTVRSTNATAVVLDNTDGSLELNVNLLIDDANINADSQSVSVRGILSLVYSVVLDD